MTRKAGVPPKKRSPAEPIEPPIDENGPGEIVVRPDGFHWIGPDGTQEFGPFETLDRARAFRDEFDERAPQPGETLQEAEEDIGIADWIDPETGAPAEGPCPPRLEDE